MEERQGLISRQAAIGTIKHMKDVCDTDDINDYYNLLIEAFGVMPSAQPEIILCNECMHNGSFDTDCPIDWAGKNYCSFAERLTDA